VLAWALIKVFYAPHAQVVRTRDAAVMKAAQIVFDVGGRYDPDHGWFDHHQASYQRPLSSAGMVLAWLEAQGHVDLEIAERLRAEIVDYVDAVDNGRLLPDRAVPCFARLVELFTAGPETPEDYDAAFHRAGDMAMGVVRGVVAEVELVRGARDAVLRAMAEAQADGRAVLFLDRYHRWKPVYYANGGALHPTDYVLFPGIEGSWRLVAIAPEEHSFAQKRPLPAAWAGLTGSTLAAATGVPGSLFCHKNRFIAVFATREAAVEALERHGLMRPAAGEP
jgi:uncharacterized UPF0160 family protein